MTAHGLDQFAPKPGQERETRRDNPFQDLQLLPGRARSRAVVMERLRQLQAEGKLRLTDILRQPEPYRQLALECLTHVYDGKPAQGDNPFDGMRFRFRCDTTEDRFYKIGVRIRESVDVGSGIAVPGETSTYQLLEPIYWKIPGGAEFDEGVIKALRLLQKYGREFATTRKQREERTMIEIDAEPQGFEAIKPTKRERAA